ncbi:hypothetical protein PQX77_014154, partial [Marasmius sp. AFHP31]
MADWFSVIFTLISIFLVPLVQGLKVNRGLPSAKVPPIENIRPPTHKTDLLSEINTGLTEKENSAGERTTGGCSPAENSANMGQTMSDVTGNVLIGLIVTI